MTEAMEENNEDESSSANASALVKALNHPMRRALLRFLLKSGPASCGEARRAVTAYIAPNLVNFHLDILVKTGAAVREKRPGTREIIYAYTDAVQAEWLQAVLKLTAAEDRFNEGGQNLER